MHTSRLLFALILGIVACSSSSSGANLNSSEAVIDLSPSDQAALCDWWASQYGGYGGSVPCGSGALAPPAQKGPTDRPTCVAGLPKASTASGCTATVGNYQTCVNFKVQHGCTATMLIFDCNAINSSLCVAVDAGAD